MTVIAGMGYDSLIARFLPPDSDFEFLRRQRMDIFYNKTDTPIPDGRLAALSEERKRKALLYVPEINKLFFDLFQVWPHSVSHLEGAGTFHFIYRITLPGNRVFILRSNALNDLQRDYGLFLDKWVMNKIFCCRQPFLNVYCVDLTRTLCPFDFEIIEMAQGRPLGSVVLGDGLLAAAGGLMAQIHGVQTEGYGLLDLEAVILNHEKGSGVLNSWSEYVNLNLEEHMKKCFEIGAVNAHECGRIEKLFSDLPYRLEGVNPVLLHGDPSNYNVFTDGIKITAIMDWEDSLSGDPVFDIAFWGTFNPDERMAPFLGGYEKIRALPVDFELRYWLYYLRISLSKTVHRHRFKYGDYPGRPPASQRIQKSLAKLESII